MKIETLKKRNWKIIVGVVAVVLIGATVILATSKAKYRTTQSIPLVRGKINWKPADLNLVAMYQEDENGEYQSIDTVPTSGYTLNETESYCEVNKEKDESITIEYSNGKILVDNLTKKGTKCYVYFDVQVTASDIILSNIPLGTGTPDFSKTSCSSGCGEATVGVYTAQDDDGTSYYFRGDVNNNYVKFAGFYWRIIRINGDGSIRLIYQGESATATGTNAQIGTIAFNTDGDNMYVGYMYTNGNVHGLGTNSTIKEVLDDWYKDNLESYASYIDTNAGFCGDRTAYTNASGTTAGGGTGTTRTYYGASIRLETNKSPVLTCANSSDLYTTESSIKGNKALTYPIGLISADEVAYAGGLGVENAYNSSYYLNTTQTYWTMSPYRFFGSTAYVFVVFSSGEMFTHYIDIASGVRPVINLKASVEFSGTGTSTDPLVPISY